MLSLFNRKDRVFYGWVVVLSGIFIGLISFGIRYSFGVFFKAFESEYDLTRVATSGIFSAYMVLASVFAFLGGWALDKFGPRKVVLPMGIFTGLGLLLTSQASASWQLYISYSLLLAIGTSPVFTIINTTVSRWFIKRRGLALGLSASGGPLGAVVMAPFATYLISNLDWRTACIIIGLISWLVMCSLAMLLRKYPCDMGLLPDGVKLESVKETIPNSDRDTRQTSLSLLNAFKTGNFWFLSFIWLLLSLNVHLMMTHIVPHAIDLGISPIDASVIVSLIGGGAIVGRIIAGKISDTVGRKIPAIVSTLLPVGAIIWLIWIKDLWMFYLFAIIFGFCWGSLGCLVTALIGDIFGMHNLGAILGATIIGWNIGAAIGPAMSGAIFDITNDYSLAFLAGGLAMLIATLLASLVRDNVKT